MSDKDAIIAKLNGHLTVFHQVLAHLIVLGADTKVILEAAETLARQQKENSSAEGPGAAVIHGHSIAGTEQAVQDIRLLISLPTHVPRA
ncbi:hypothetical protein G6M50_36785 [Agrobacterium rhizogenes]|nr:hypothetical protein [Rhizobium rhizogenes]NTJ83344.1 hypothetical protein [Rhizobium rhizogenes]